MDSTYSEKLESLSAVMDGEANQDEVNKVIKDLLADNSLQKQWQMNHLVADLAAKWNAQQPHKTIDVKSWDALVEHYESQADLSTDVPSVTATSKSGPTKLTWDFPRLPFALATSVVLVFFLATAIYFNIPDEAGSPFVAQSTPDPLQVATEVRSNEPLDQSRVADSSGSENVMSMIKAHEDRKRAELGDRLQPYSVLVNTRQLSNAPLVRRVSAK